MALLPMVLLKGILSSGKSRKEQQILDIETLMIEYHAGQNDYRPAFFISTSNSCKNDQDPVKDPRIPGKCQNEFPV